MEEKEVRNINVNKNMNDKKYYQNKVFKKKRKMAKKKGRLKNTPKKIRFRRNRETSLARIRSDYLGDIKILARHGKITISKLFDRVIIFFIKHNKDDARIIKEFKEAHNKNKEI